MGTLGTETGEERKNGSGGTRVDGLVTERPSNFENSPKALRTGAPKESGFRSVAGLVAWGSCSMSSAVCCK